MPEVARVRSCPNCGALVADLYCGHCGQRNSTRLVSVRRMIMDALEDQLSVNSALPRTLGGLLFRPGFLTREYVQGRIVRYIAPFRLYLLTSVLFFLGLSLTANAAPDQDVRDDPSVNAILTDSEGRPLSLTPDTIRAQIEVEWLSPEMERRLEDVLIPRILRWQALGKREAGRALQEGLMRNAPKAMFFLLPVFALLLKLLYVRSRRFYVEHFVFALHFHAFVFAIATLMMGVETSPVDTLLVLWILVYLFLAMRRVYGQSRLKTSLKYGALFISYVFVLALAGAATALVTALFV